MKRVDFKVKDFNFTSDLHLDFYKNRINIRKLNEIFMKDVIKSDILIIAGDFSNNNNETYTFFDSIHDKWKYIIFTDGNHDSYDDKYKKEKDYRVNKLKNYIKKYPNIIYLEPETGIVEFNNVRIAGCNLWYDMQNPSVLFDIRDMNDVGMIGLNRIIENSEQCLNFYNNVIDKVDIFVSHVPVIDQFSKNMIKNNCYYRNLKLRENKIYIFGHMHEGKSEYLKEMNIQLLTKPIGYRPNSETRFGYFKLKNL